MGGRKNEWKIYKEKPYLLFYILSAFGIIYGIFGIANSPYLTFGTPALILGCISLVIGIAIHIYINSNDTATSDYTPTTPLINPDLISVNENSTDTIGTNKRQSVLSALPDVLNTECILQLMDSVKQRIQFQLLIYEEQYKLVNVIFNEQTRHTKVEFECTKKYRTIERYVQRNYQRYPVYSNWKYSTKRINHSIKLNNAMLESKEKILRTNEIIDTFIEQILIRINNIQIIPSWIIKKWLLDELHIAERYERAMNLSIDEFYNNKVNIINKQIQAIEEQIRNEIENRNRIDKKLSKIKDKPKKAVKIQNFCDKLSEIDTLLCNLNFQKNEFIKQIQASNQERENLKKQNHDLFLKNQASYQKLLPQVKTLAKDIEKATKFLKLKDLSGIEYRKIIGCYVIRNTKNKKCYVGQSKDVIRRLKQHFKGTVPNNPIFAEDYYTTPEAERETLFEVRIIELQTKDELDRTEKELIEEYDCFNAGYNGTHGNT